MAMSTTPANFNYAEFKEKLEKLSKEMTSLEIVDFPDLEPGILDIVLPAFGNILNTLMEKGTVQTRKRLLKWTGSHFTKMKKSMDSDPLVNPFLNLVIIQRLAAPEINPDAKTLQNLRQLSTLYNQILNPKYFDQVQLALEIIARENKILFSSRHGPQVPLGPKIWDPITFAPTIRKLILDGKELDYLLSSSNSTSMIGGINPLELISQIFPYVTTLQIDLPGIYDFWDEAIFNLTDFLQQFSRLKKLNLIPDYTKYTHNLDNLEKILFNIDNNVFLRKFEIELSHLWDLKPEYLEILLSPERSFITKNHKFSLNIPVTRHISHYREIRAWARILPRANNLIPPKNFSVKLYFEAHSGEVEKNEILKILSIMNPYIVGLTIEKNGEGIENLLFTSQNWLRLKSLAIFCNKMTRLVGLSTICPNLDKLELSVVESESIFTNPELTDEENLYQIFGNCFNTLKILRFSHNRHYLGARLNENCKITPGSKLLQYLQELLPNTLIEVV